jgi:uncharacterized membrane protein YeaQ/YmgE (transglycosylase-associated protein family)
MDITGLIIQLVAGAIGGNAGGMLAKARSLGPLLNTVLGAVGGLGGGQLLGPMLGGGTPATVGASAVIGALLPIIGGFLKQKA